MNRQTELHANLQILEFSQVYDYAHEVPSSWNFTLLPLPAHCPARLLPKPVPPPRVLPQQKLLVTVFSHAPQIPKNLLMEFLYIFALCLLGYFLFNYLIFNDVV
jgi:hypothetical protein